MPPSSTEFDDPAFLDRLRRGEAEAYRRLIRRFHASLVGVAAAVIGSHAQAEEVVQDAWLAVFSGIGRFEGRSAIGTWLFSIVLNRARTRRGREVRLVALPTESDDDGAHAARFAADGHWLEFPRPWDELDPERLVAGRQLWDHVRAAIDRLPAGQRAVILLRDVEGQDAETACELLGISAENQRVLLHRARLRVRDAIDLLAGGAQRQPASHGRKPAARGAPAAKRPVRLRLQCSVRSCFRHDTDAAAPRWQPLFTIGTKEVTMRMFILRVVAGLAALGAISASALAAPTLNGVEAARHHRPDIVQADYYYHHHHYHHRHWDHDHWRYY